MANWTKEQQIFITTAYFSQGKKYYPSSANLPKRVQNENFFVEEDSPAMSKEFLKFWQHGQEQI